MAEVWAKIAASIHRNPKIRMAGRDAREVFVLVLCMNADLKADGELPGFYVEPAYLADALMCTEDEARNGVERCETFHLLRVTGGRSSETGHDSLVSIVGWDQDWKIITSTDRVRKYRERQREALRNVTSVSCNGETPRGEERRVDQGEERRGEGEENARARENSESGKTDESKERDKSYTPASDVARNLANEIWQEQEELRSELKLDGIGLETRGLGLTSPAKSELLQRITESLAGGKELAEIKGDLRHVLSVLEGDCRLQRSLRWLDGQHWRADRYTPTLTRTPGESFRQEHEGSASVDDVLGGN